MKKFYESTRDINRSVSCVCFKNGFVSPHFHQSVEILIVFEGTLPVNVGSNTYQVKKGNLICIPPFFPHSILTKTENKYYTLIISSPYLKDFFADMTDTPPLLFCKTNDDFLKLTKSLLTLPKSKTLLRGKVNTILGHIIENGNAEVVPEKNNSFVREIIDYIELNFRENITLLSISEHFGYSKYHFSRLFNQNFNCSLNSYINRIRAENVEKNAITSNISDAVYESGFNTLSTYYRTKNKL